MQLATRFKIPGVLFAITDGTVSGGPLRFLLADAVAESSAGVSARLPGRRRCRRGSLAGRDDNVLACMSWIG
eukprot:224870-Hanusia_phi.AAC.1